LENKIALSNCLEIVFTLDKKNPLAIIL